MMLRSGLVSEGGLDVSEVSDAQVDLGSVWDEVDQLKRGEDVAEVVAAGFGLCRCCPSE